MAASGAVALYHAEGLTPEARDYDVSGLESIHVGSAELEATFEKLNTGETPDIAILGCPHASLREIAILAEKLEGKTLKRPIWICTSRVMKEAATRMGFTEIIEAAGGRVVADTCMVVSPIEDMGFSTTGVNSGKAGNYLPGFCNQNVVFQSVDELVRRCLQ